jgi:hypothetical protein
MKSIITFEILLAASGIIISIAIIGLVIERFVLHRFDKLARLTLWDGDELIISSRKGLA